MRRIALISLAAVITAGAGLAVAQTKAAGKVTTLAEADADLKARGTWIKAELERVAGVVARKPPASRPMFKTRSGKWAPDPRPTPAQALESARAAVKKVDPAIEAASGMLKAVASDKDAFERQLAFARLHVNETVELVLIALKDTDVPSVTPAWLGEEAKQLPADAAVALEKEIAATIFDTWQADNPGGAGGVGVAGAGGKETVYSLAQGQTVRGLADVASPRVSFRLNPKTGTASVKATTPNFTLVLLRPVTVGKVSLGEGALVEKRLSTWWSRPKVPDVVAK